MFNYIYHNFQEDLKIQAVADKFGVTVVELNRILLFQAERNFEDFLNYLRVNKACELMLSTKMSITDIAIEVGYNTVKTFSRNFVKLKSMTPATFRKRIILQHGGESHTGRAVCRLTRRRAPPRAGAPRRGGFCLEKVKSIKDIARMAGVSTATVSRVINQNGRFSKETEARVRRIIRETEYVPNMSAKGLRTSRTRVVGIIVPDITNPHFASLVLKLEINLFQRGYSCLICNTNESEKLERKHIQSLSAQNVSAIVLISGTRNYSELDTLPVIYVDRPSRSQKSSGVIIESDNEQGRLSGNKRTAGGRLPAHRNFEMPGQRCEPAGPLHRVPARTDGIRPERTGRYVRQSP